MKKYRNIGLILGLSLTLSACGLVEKVDKDGNPVDPNQPEVIEDYEIGSFDGEPVTFYDLQQELNPISLNLVVQYGPEFLTGDGEEFYNQLHHVMVNKIMEDRILDKKAGDSLSEDVLQEAKAQAEGRIAEMKKLHGEKYEQSIKELFFDSVEEYENHVLRDEQRKAFYRAFRNDITVTEKEIREEYENTKDQRIMSAGAKIYHIYLGNDKEEALAEGKKALEGLDADKSFSEMVQKYSQDVAAGDEGFLGRHDYETTELYADFMDHVKKLEEGEISGIVKSTAGYHIIRVEDVQKEDVQLTYDEVKESIEKELYERKLSAKYQEDMAKWREEHEIIIHEDKLPELPEPEEPVEEEEEKEETEGE